MLLHATSLHESFDIAPIEGEVMSPGLEMTPLRARQHGREIVAERKRLAVEICYCSTLDECWLLHSSNPFDPETTRSIAECVPDAKPFSSTGASFFDGMLLDHPSDAKRTDGGGPTEPSEP